jgi:hypothetical protein
MMRVTGYFKKAFVNELKASVLEMPFKGNQVKQPRSTYEHQGCQIFLGKTYQNGKNIPNDHKIPQMA